MGCLPIRDSERLSGLHPDQPAYVIYTSGSTGRAKGVVVSHRCVLTLLDATIPMFDLGPADVWTAFHSYAFDFSVWEIWAPLLTGGRTVVVPSEATWSGDEFLALLEAERVTVLNQTPSSFASLERADADGAKALHALRLVIFGGEALDPARLSAWFARRPSRPRMVNMYGITETTVHVTAIDILPEMSLASSESPIGRPLPGFRDHVFDEGLRPVADGQVGELYLGGAQVSRGYFDRPALTATRFVADPDSHGGRLYRTGDLVRPLRGNLNFIGRADTQLSLRGSGSSRTRLRQRSMPIRASQRARSPSSRILTETKVRTASRPMSSWPAGRSTSGVCGYTWHACCRRILFPATSCCWQHFPLPPTEN